MLFSEGHTACTSAETNALMSEVFAMQCSSEAARALMSEVFAQQSALGSRLRSGHAYSYRYC